MSWVKLKFSELTAMRLEIEQLKAALAARPAPESERFFSYPKEPDEHHPGRDPRDAHMVEGTLEYWKAKYLGAQEIVDAFEKENERLTAPVSGDMMVSLEAAIAAVLALRSPTDDTWRSKTANAAAKALRALPSVAPDYEAAFQVWAGWQASRQRGDGQKMIKAIVIAALTVKE